MESNPADQKFLSSLASTDSAGAENAQHLSEGAQDRK